MMASPNGKESRTAAFVNAVGNTVRTIISNAVSIIVHMGTLFTEATGNASRAVMTGSRSLALSATGVDGKQLDAQGTPEERNRFIILGSIVVLTACFATVGSVFFFWQVFEPREELWTLPLALGLAVLWGLMVFNIDRIFLSTMLGRKHWWQRMYSGVFRLILAGILGYVISHPLKVLFFWDTISSYDAYQYQDIYNDYKDDLQKKIVSNEREIEKFQGDIYRYKSQDSMAQLVNHASDQYKLAEDLVTRESSREGRADILEKYAPQNGVIEGLEVPLKAGFSPSFKAPLVGEVECRSDDRMLKEYYDFEEEGTAPPDPWRRELYARYRDYSEGGSSELGDATGRALAGSTKEDDEGGFKITSCGLGRILMGLWWMELKRMEEQRRGSVDNTQLVRSLEERVDFHLQEISGEQERARSAETVASELAGGGYAHYTALLWRLSRPEDVDEEIRGLEEVPPHAFFNKSHRKAIFLIGWAIAAIFIFVEMAPVLTKIFLLPGPYEQGLGERRDEKGEESAERRRSQRQYDELDRESRQSSWLASRSQAQSYLLGMHRIEATRLADELEKPDSYERQQEIFSTFAQREEEIRKYAKRLSRDLGDDQEERSNP